MKLNYKKTILVGFAFFLICAFWQAYDTLVPKMLVVKFGLNQTWSGVVMALDNVFALFLLPFFGRLSDKSKSKYGRRTPYIFIGTIIACVTFILMSFSDNLQLLKITNDGIPSFFNTQFSEQLALLNDENKALEIATELARQKAWEVTLSNPLPLIMFAVALLATLLSMSIFRSPAVALMPDVTVKPLRSKANAVINLMGTAGGIIVLVLGIVLKTGQKENTYMSYVIFIIAVVVIMLISLLVFLFTVKERKWVNQMEIESKEYGIFDEEDEKSNSLLAKEKIISLMFILFSVALWYMGYNAVTSKYSLYAGSVLQKDYNLTLLIAQGAAIASYIPVGILASKIGRKKSIIIGVLILAFSFGCAIFVRATTSTLVMNLIFALAGIGWATINVNSFPMVVELAKGSDTGKFTGYYYTASMAGQIVTPILSGWIMDLVGNMKPLFVYATICVILAFVTMLFVKHGDSKPVTPKSKLEMIGSDD